MVYSWRCLLEELSYRSSMQSTEKNAGQADHVAKQDVRSFGPEFVEVRVAYLMEFARAAERALLATAALTYCRTQP